MAATPQIQVNTEPRHYQKEAGGFLLLPATILCFISAIISGLKFGIQLYSYIRNAGDESIAGNLVSGIGEMLVVAYFFGMAISFGVGAICYKYSMS